MDSYTIDMALFNEANPRERLMEGDTLMSTLCRPMMTFVQETPAPKGVHDTHNRMCNRYLYESYGFGPRDGCHENISKAVASRGLLPEGIPDTMDLIVGLSNCPLDVLNACNGYNCTPVKIEVYAPA